MQIKRSTPFALRDDYIEHTHIHTYCWDVEYEWIFFIIINMYKI